MMTILVVRVMSSWFCWTLVGFGKITISQPLQANYPWVMQWLVWLDAPLPAWIFGNMPSGGESKGVKTQNCSERNNGSELLSSDADLNIIVSRVQIWTTNPAMESWGQFPKEQERLWNLVQDMPKPPWDPSCFGVETFVMPRLLASQDISKSPAVAWHIIANNQLYGQLHRPILESFFEDHRWKEDSFFVGLNYGVLKVDWNTRVATVEIKNDQGDTVLQVDQMLDISPLQLPLYEKLLHKGDGHLIPWLMRILRAVIVMGLLTRLIPSPLRWLLHEWKIACYLACFWTSLYDFFIPHCLIKSTKCSVSCKHVSHLHNRWHDKRGMWNG